MPLGQASRCSGTYSNAWGTVLDFSSQHRDEKDEEARRQRALCSVGLAGWERHVGCLLDVLARNPLWGELRPMLFHVRLELPSEGPWKHYNSPKLIFLVAGIFIPMLCCFSESVFSVWKLTVKWQVSRTWAWNSVWSLMSGVPEVPSSSWLWHVGALAGSWAHRVESAVHTTPTVRLPPRASPSLGSRWQPPRSPLLLLSHVRHARMSSLCWS